MKIKKITILERVCAEHSLETLISMGCWRLLGAMWHKWIEVYADQKTGDLVMRYE